MFGDRRGLFASRPAGSDESGHRCPQGAVLRKGCKPDSVFAGHPAERTIYLSDLTRDPAGLRRSATSRRSGPLFGLAPGEVFRARSLNVSGGGLLPRLFTLTELSSGGLFSVALSVRRTFARPSRVYLS